MAGSLDSSPAHAPLSPLRFLQRSGDVWADRTAVGFGDTRLTYAALLARAERIAVALRGFGVETGDRVATLLPNVPAMLELHFAIPGAGGVIVPMNTRLSVAEHAYILEHSGARCLVTCADFVHLAENAVSTLDDPPRVLVADGPEYQTRSEERRVGKECRSR